MRNRLSYFALDCQIQKRPRIYDELLDVRDISNLNYDVVAGLDHNIDITAKAIIYIFSPEIDLLQNIQNDLQHYDKFEKTKLILRELINHIYTGKTTFEEEVYRTSEEIMHMGEQIKDLNTAFRQLQRDNNEKDEDINHLKNRIIVLAKAYEQSKFCYEDEILDYKFQIEECKMREARQKQLLIQTTKNNAIINKQKQKNPAIYTDRSIFKRFSASSLQDHEPMHDAIKDQFIKQENIKTPSAKIYFDHKTINDQLLYEKDVAEHKLLTLKEEMDILKTQNEVARNRLERQISELRTTIETLSSQLSLKTQKIAQKNQTINDLLDIIN